MRKQVVDRYCFWDLGSSIRLRIARVNWYWTRVSTALDVTKCVIRIFGRLMILLPCLEQLQETSGDLQLAVDDADSLIDKSKNRLILPIFALFRSAEFIQNRLRSPPVLTVLIFEGNPVLFMGLTRYLIIVGIGGNISDRRWYSNMK